MLIICFIKISFSYFLVLSQVRERCIRPEFLRRTLRSINQQENKVQTFFLARTTFHLRRPATVSYDLSAKRCCAVQPRETAKQHGLQRQQPPHVLPSFLIAALTQPLLRLAIEASGKVAAKSGLTEYRSVARGTRNIRFRNELTLRCPTPSLVYKCVYIYI